MYKMLERSIAHAVCGPVLGVTASRSMIVHCDGFGFIITETPDIVENTDRFAGFDGDKVIILPFSDECTGRFAWLRSIALVGMVSGVATSQTEGRFFRIQKGIRVLVIRSIANVVIRTRQRVR